MYIILMSLMKTGHFQSSNSAGNYPSDPYFNIALQRLRAVSAYITGKQILPFSFARIQSWRLTVFCINPCPAKMY